MARMTETIVPKLHCRGNGIDLGFCRHFDSAGDVAADFPVLLGGLFTIDNLVETLNDRCRSNQNSVVDYFDTIRVELGVALNLTLIAKLTRGDEVEMSTRDSQNIPHGVDLNALVSRHLDLNLSNTSNLLLSTVDQREKASSGADLLQVDERFVN